MKNFQRVLGFHVVCATALALGDDLQPLGDEFDDASTLANWQDIGVVEGWGTPSVQAHDINLTTPGHFRIQPGALSWFGHLRGSLFFKQVTGDFVATGKFRILSRHNPADLTEVPNRSFSLSGILIHGPRTITQAAPNPYTSSAVWPPGDFGSDYLPNTENYIFLSYGSAGNPGTRQFEIKATRNSNSRLYYSSNGVGNHEVWLQLVRIGDTVVCLRKHSEGGDWIVENRYPNPDHPFPDFGPTLQVGITAYTDWPTAAPFNSAGLEACYHFNYAPPTNGQPDLISEVDYFRFQRPDPALTEATLQGMAVSYDPAINSTASPPVLLSASPAASAFLGEAANVEVGSLIVDDVVVSESSASVIVPVRRMGSSSGEVSLSYSTADGTAFQPADYAEASGTLTWADGVSGIQNIVIPMPVNAQEEGLEYFTMTFDGVDGPANFSGGDLSRTVRGFITETIYDQWRLDSFGADALSPSAAAGADFDGDGIANLLEIILGGIPTQTDVGLLPRYVMTADRPEFRFQPALAAGLVTLSIETSPDLSAESWTVLATRSVGEVNWTEMTEEVSVAFDEETDEVVLVDALPTDSPRFLRLRVTVEN